AFFFSSRRRHTRFSRDWSSDVCSSDLRDNLVIDHPHSNGVWYDVGNVDGVFANNYVEGTQIGFFFEISKGVVVAGNVFVNNAQEIGRASCRERGSLSVVGVSREQGARE